MSEDTFRFPSDEDDSHEAPPDLDDDEGLSKHPETVARRKRRRKTAGKKRGPYKPRVPTGGEVTSRLRESLGELASALENRDPELSRVLKRDGPKMAELLGKWGEHPKTPPPLKVAVVMIAEILEPLRAFGGTARLLLRRLRERQLREPEPEPDEGEQPWAPAEVPVEEIPTPDRFRIDAEPPDVN